MQKNLTVIHEFGILSDAQKHKVNIGEEVSIPHKSFENLWNFILENRGREDADNVMSVHVKGGRPYIKTSRYVGTIQTKDGQIIEILPKIYKNGNKEEDDIKLCRRVFLRMLSSFQHSDAKTFQDASLDTHENFPILESYISHYLSEVEQLLMNGIKKNYTLINENQKFLKGKFLISRQIVKNCTNKTHFAVRYSKYIENIPQNRIIVSTLFKFLMTSQNPVNVSRCYALLSAFSDIPQCTNVEADLQISIRSDRLFSSYKNLLQWSSQFLLNKGFTTFSGNHVNQSLLFSAEQLFESFIAHLFKKYAKNYIVSSQHSKYYLVDKYGDTKKGKFRLRPDIVVESKEPNSFSDYDIIIIDTKWKNLDSSAPEKNYLIDIKDMYQLFAYGQKYHLGDSYYLDIIPKLVLIYPYTEKFQEKLDTFWYEEIKEKYGLRLIVYPFNLASFENKGYEKQIEEIIKLASTFRKETVNDKTKQILSNNFKVDSDDRYMLIGYYRDDIQLEWIDNNRLYYIDSDNTSNILNDKGVQIIPSRLVLYTKQQDGTITGIHVYIIHQSQILVATKEEMMESLKYPDPESERVNLYKLFSLGEEIKNHKKFDIKQLMRDNGYDKNNCESFVIKY